MTCDDVIQVRQQFLLTESELILDTYKVTLDKTPGTLVLTTSYLLFDSVFSGSAESDDQIAIELIDITDVSKVTFVFAKNLYYGTEFYRKNSHFCWKD